MSYTTSLLRWLQRKRYQYEVTFSLYMLTPTEKFIFSEYFFNLPRLPFSSRPVKMRYVKVAGTDHCPPIDSFLFLFISMIIIAASLYLPEHVVNMWYRAWFYYAGDDTAVAAGKPDAVDIGGGGSGRAHIGSHDRV